MAAKKGSGKVSEALEKAIAAEVEEISKKGDDGKFVHSVIDRMRVYDKALKLESIKAKLPDEDYGSKFK